MPKKTAGVEDNSHWCEWCQEYRNSSRSFDKHAKSCRATYEARMDREALHYAKRRRTGESSNSAVSIYKSVIRLILKSMTGLGTPNSIKTISSDGCRIIGR